MKIPYRAAAAAAVALLGLASFAAPVGAKSPGTQQTSVIYSSLVASPLPGNLPSVGYEATSTSEFGNQVTFSGTNRQLTNVVVTMSSWGCVTGHWYSGDCSTPAGATFSEPITLNLYGISGGTLGTPTSVTQTFAIPYRPSASPKCGDGRWYDSSLKNCFNGTAVNVTFNLSGVTVPDTLVYGIAYNTSNYGYGPPPVGVCPAGGCGYDSLNVALTQDPSNVSAGSDTTPGTVWWNTSYGPNYCDGGAVSGTFRADGSNNCVGAPYTGWSVDGSGNSPYYVPAVQFKAAGGHS